MTAMVEKKTSSRARPAFDFSAPAEVFGGGSWAGRPTNISYRRFESSAEAIRYVIEELDESARRPCVMEVNEKRYNHLDLRRLYESSAYPLPKEKGKAADAT